MFLCKYVCHFYWQNVNGRIPIFDEGDSQWDGGQLDDDEFVGKSFSFEGKLLIQLISIITWVYAIKLSTIVDFTNLDLHH